jgi:hypothetical protein
MSDRSKIAAASKNIVFVPLNKLKRSPKNVRQVPHGKADIQALSASIAAIGTNPVALEGPPWERNKARIATSRLGSMPAPEPRRPFRLSRKPNLRRQTRLPHPNHRRIIGQDGSERY